MFKNLLISILGVTVMMQSGFITPSNPAAAVVAPVAWYFVIMFTLVWIDFMRHEKRKHKKRGPQEAATSRYADQSIYHSFIVNGKEE